MSDYIKRKEYKLPDGRTVTAYFNELGVARITIQAMDALFDILNSSVEVVRCKDCKHNHCELVAGEECWLCGLGHEGHKIDRQDFYCADGERKEE